LSIDSISIFKDYVKKLISYKLINKYLIVLFAVKIITMVDIFKEKLALLLLSWGISFDH